MNGSATRLRHINLCVWVRISFDLRRLQWLVSINNLQKFLPLLQKLKNHFVLLASSTSVHNHSGVVLYLRKRPQPNELNSPHKIFCLLATWLCFACLQHDHMFKTKPGCESTHNVLLHGAKKVFSARPVNKESNISNNTSHSNSNNTATPNRNKQQTSSSNVAGSPPYKKLKWPFPVLRLEIRSHRDVTTALVMCNSCCTHSWVSAGLAKRLYLTG